MLVLSRKIEERILIGDDVVITVTRIGRNVVSIGVDAPKDVPIRRADKKSETSPEAA